MTIKNVKVNIKEHRILERNLEREIRYCGQVVTSDSSGETCIRLEQVREIEAREIFGDDCVQAFVNNISFSQTLEELAAYAELSLVDNVRQSTETEWTVPKWAKIGDIVFFMHSKTAKTAITRLRTELINMPSISRVEYLTLMDAINDGLATYKRFGGKIFAIGRVCGALDRIQEDEDFDCTVHWHSRYYAKIDNIYQLENPVDIADFRDIVYISRGSGITPVFGGEFTGLINLIEKTNTIPSYFKNCQSKPLPLRKIDKENWITVANNYRRAFLCEKQFRIFYVDYLLKRLGSRATIYAECRCKRADINDSFMDNVIYLNGKYLPVEVKLTVAAEPNIKAQVNKYCYNTEVWLDQGGTRILKPDELYPGKVLIIDTDSIYIYDYGTDTVSAFYQLDDIKMFSDIDVLKKNLISFFGQ